MDKLRLLPLELPSATNINNNGTVKGKISFVRRLAVGFVILATLGLLYVPAYHSAQGPFLGLGETPSPAKHIGVSHLVASVGMHPLTLLEPLLCYKLTVLYKSAFIFLFIIISQFHI